MEQAVFFDFDGVIVDSEPLHYQAYQEILAPMGMGFPWEDYMAVYIGFDDREVFGRLFGQRGRAPDAGDLHDLMGRKAAAFLRIVRQSPPAVYPGVRALVEGLRGRVPLGLCTGALPGDIEPILSAIGLDTAFDVRVTAADVHASKPDPASYRLARERLEARHPERRFPAERCVAIEDTPAGIEAAAGAGLRVLAVATTHPRSALRRAARVVDSLTEVAADDVLKLGHG